MVTGDGNNRRPKQQKTTQTTEASTSTISKSASLTPALALQRVMSAINVPVRRQIKYAKSKKERERRYMTNTSFQAKESVKTAYRKKLDKFMMLRVTSLVNMNFVLHLAVCRI
jgi:hypothetical protein